MINVAKFSDDGDPIANKGFDSASADAVTGIKDNISIPRSFRN